MYRMNNWKYITIAALIVIMGLVILFASFNEPRSTVAYQPVMFFNKSGQVIKIARIYTDTLTPNTGNGFVIDYAMAGFASVSSVNVLAQRNTATATSVPNVAIKSFNNTQAVVNIIEGNGTLVTVLGLSVLSGASTQFADPTGLKLHVQILGN